MTLRELNQFGRGMMKWLANIASHSEDILQVRPVGETRSVETFAALKACLDCWSWRYALKLGECCRVSAHRVSRCRLMGVTTVSRSSSSPPLKLNTYGPIQIRKVSYRFVLLDEF